jgi:uncharacterized membrane protein YqiK
MPGMYGAVAGVAILGQASGINYLVISVVAIALLLVVGFVVLLTRLYWRVVQGQALIINKPGETLVTFHGATVVPFFYQAEYMDISVKQIDIERNGHDGLICKDNIRADIRITFFVRVNEDEKDVLRVAKMVGCAKASDPTKLEELFGAKFSEALKTAGKQFDFEELYTKRQGFRDSVREVIGDDLNGYTLEDVAIDYLEQTKVDNLDPHNVLDADGIRKITEQTEEQRVRTTELTNNANKRIGKDNLETKRAMLEYDRQQADAVARQQREITVVQAQQKAEAEEIKSRERARELRAQLEADKEINIFSTNKQRDEQVTEVGRERALILERESVEKERSLVAISREREVEVQRIEKDRDIEHKRKEIVEVVRERTALEKGVAQEQEQIKDIHVLSEAERVKRASLIVAEGEAQTKLVADIKAAEAAEKAAEFKARQRIVEADTELEAADRTAKAKIRAAEGIQAERAAGGLADVRVLEAQAIVLEKQGMVEARVMREKMTAEAAGNEQKGMIEIKLREQAATIREREGEAEASVVRSRLAAEASGVEQKGLADAKAREALAAANQKQGMAEAAVVRERMLAEAAGTKERGLSDAIAKEAMAAAIEKQGMAEANVMTQKLNAEASGIREKLLAEASGISEKAAAMKQFDASTRQHEEFRLTLEVQKELERERLRTNVDMAREQAIVYGEAFKAAKINIVGGDEGFYKNFLGSIALGQTVDGFLNSSKGAKRLFDKVVGADPAEVAEVEDNSDAQS